MIPMNVYPASSVVPIFFTSYGKTNGESITLTGLAVTDIEIYKGTSMTQRSSDAGYALLDTDGIDIDSITGLHGFSIDLGDNTDAGFFAVGSFYTVVVSAVTIDAQTVTFIADRFRIAPAEGLTGMPKVDVAGLLGTAWLTPGTAGTPDVNTKLLGGTAQTGKDIGSLNLSSGKVLIQGTIDQFDDFVDAAGKVTLNAASITSMWTDTTASDFTVALSIGKSIMNGVSLGTGLTVASVSGAVGSVTGLTAALVHSDLDDIQARLPAALVGGRIDANVGSKTAGLALTAQEKADVNAEVVDTLNVDTYAEPGQETPAATNTIVGKLGYLFKNWRNKKTNDGTTEKLYNSTGATVDQKRSVSEAAGTVTKDVTATGP